MGKRKTEKKSKEAPAPTDVKPADKKAARAEEKKAAKAAKKAAKAVAKSPIGTVRVMTLDWNESARATYDPVGRSLDLMLPGGAPGPKGEPGPAGPPLDLSQGPKDGQVRELFVDRDGHLCFRIGSREFVVALVPKD
jgi:hypothetical protein